ncbi:hypothetical protein M3Y96_00080800 [Aphelenchoides besseyi]|nr:hypothetical protein M3Y96_00080800 [Aphelenchoides besseyi]
MGKADSTWSSELDLNDDFFFDPNNSRYKCLCKQVHSTTGVRLIAVFLLLSVALEIYQLLWYVAFTDDKGDRLLSAAFQLSIGAALAISSENPFYLSPYMLFMTVGLAAGTVILVALLYISISADLDTIRSFLESQIPNAVLDELEPQSLVLFGWALVASAAVLLVVQYWLLSIVFACWRYFRDKREFGYSNKNSKSLVVLYPYPSSKQETSNCYRHFIRSKSAEEFNAKRSHLPLGHAMSCNYTPCDTLIIA